MILRFIIYLDFNKENQRYSTQVVIEDFDTQNIGNWSAVYQVVDENDV